MNKKNIRMNQVPCNYVKPAFGEAVISIESGSESVMENLSDSKSADVDSYYYECTSRPPNVCSYAFVTGEGLLILSVL